MKTHVTNLRDADIKIWFDQDVKELKKETTEPANNYIFIVLMQLWRMLLEIEIGERGEDGCNQTWVNRSTTILPFQFYHYIVELNTY